MGGGRRRGAPLAGTRRRLVVQQRPRQIKVGLREGISWVIRESAALIRIRVPQTEGRCTAAAPLQQLGGRRPELIPSWSMWLVLLRRRRLLLVFPRTLRFGLTILLLLAVALLGSRPLNLKAALEAVCLAADRLDDGLSHHLSFAHVSRYGADLTAPMGRFRSLGQGELGRRWRRAAQH